jgi:hypothetical protein
MIDFEAAKKDSEAIDQHEGIGSLDRHGTLNLARAFLAIKAERDSYKAAWEEVPEDFAEEAAHVLLWHHKAAIAVRHGLPVEGASEEPCPECGGTREVWEWHGDAYRGGKYKPCPRCSGKKEMKGE